MTPVDKNKFDAYMFTLLVAKIKNTKNDYDSLLMDGEYLKGSRYNNDERIAMMVLGDIFTECKRDYFKANEKFVSLNSVEIEPYIKEAVLDSASCDYYYTYEKQW